MVLRVLMLLRPRLEILHRPRLAAREAVILLARCLLAPILLCPASRPGQPQSSWAGAILLRPCLVTKVADLQVRATPQPPPPSSRSQGNRSSGQGGRLLIALRLSLNALLPLGNSGRRLTMSPGPKRNIVQAPYPTQGPAPKRPRKDAKPAKAKKSAKSKSGQKNWGIPHSDVPDSAAGLQGDEQPDSLRCRTSRRPSFAPWFNAVANVGLHVFAPDVFGNPESLIWASKEEQRPGCVGVDIVLNTFIAITTRPCTLPKSPDDCFMNKTIARLAAENECHSDNEELADGSAFMVHEKPGRDSAVSGVFEVLTTEGARLPYHKNARKEHGAAVFANEDSPPSDFSRARPTNDRAIYMTTGSPCPLWSTARHDGHRKVEWSKEGGLHGSVRQAKLALYELQSELSLPALDNDLMDNDD
ncbi:hypothetical protein B0H14DRAFT_2659406 [Mycena olivaceomarginata]|nr:hypothetical protein B0H14DRAFT_2659406 [Mycena olivaceomarginata]